MSEKGLQIEKIKLSDIAGKRIREMIIKKELKSGERIVETRIAKMLGISQAPVREALKELEVMGLVEIKPYSGCYVVPIDKKKLLQIYSLRTMLESFAAKQGAENISETVIKQMEKHIKSMKKAAANMDTAALVESDVLFHREIVKVANNKTLERMWELIGAPQWSRITISAKENPNYEYFANSHNELLRLFKQRNIDAVPDELEKHFSTAASFIIEGVVES